MKNALVPALLMSLSLSIPLSAWGDSEDAFRGHLPSFQSPFKENHQWSERKQQHQKFQKDNKEYREENHREKRNFREKDETRYRPEKIGHYQHKPSHQHGHHYRQPYKHPYGHQPFTDRPHNLKWWD